MSTESASEVTATIIGLSADGRAVRGRWTCPDCKHKKNGVEFFLYTAYWRQCEKCGAHHRVLCPEHP